MALAIVSNYRDSPVSAVFWSPGNRTIGKTALIGDWFNTKMTILDFWIFKVHFFSLQNNFSLYRDSPFSAVFGFPANRTIGKTALIGDWFSTKMVILDFWIFKVHFFSLLSKMLIRNTRIYCTNRETISTRPTRCLIMRVFLNQRT